MGIDHELKRLLAAELSAIIDGLDQYHAAAKLGIHQPHISALRHGKTGGFSSDRLVRLIARCGYNVDVVLREMPRRFGDPRVKPTVTVQRLDRHGRTLGRPALGPVKRVRRWSGEVEGWTVASIEHRHPHHSEDMDSRFDMDDLVRTGMRGKR